MTRLRLIGFGYKRRSGKDTAADRLVSCHGFQRMPFAEALKSAAGHIFGFTREQLYGNLKDVVDPYWKFTPGWALQQLGTEACRRVFGDDVWVRRLEKRLSLVPDFSPGVVIPDVRFHNEVEMVLRCGGKVYRVDRAVEEEEHGGGRSAVHQSETELDGFTGWSGVLDNNGTKETLWAQVDRLVSHGV